MLHSLFRNIFKHVEKVSVGESHLSNGIYVLLFDVFDNAYNKFV